MLHPAPAQLWTARLLVALLLGLTLWALWTTSARATAANEPAIAGPETTAEPAPSGHEHANAVTPEALIASLYILILAGFVGFEVIGGVSPLLHTPLMSVTNAISAISIVGALVIAGSTRYVFDASGETDYVSCILGFFAVLAASINVVGGFMITDRMLRMFKAKEGRR